MHTATDRGVRRPMIRNYAQSPLMVYWEVTRACELACQHCRAEAMPLRHLQELSTDEGFELLRQIADFGAAPPNLVLTGGDPLMRPDLFALIAEGRRLGIPVSITPSATPRLTDDAITALKAAGIEGFGLSLDGSNAALHDEIRGIPGCFERTMAALEAATPAGLPVQINTLITAKTAADLPAIYSLLAQYPITRWSLFFLISVGRGQALQDLEPAEAERLMHWIYDVSRSAPFAIKTTEAPWYRRVALQRMSAEGLTVEQIKRSPVYRGFQIRDGHGIVFVSHRGAIYPSGFLPRAAGNVRRDKLADVYQASELFAGLHQPSLFKGKCGQCEFRVICGGSRARAFAATGDPMASDPLCPYQPERGAALIQ